VTGTDGDTFQAVCIVGLGLMGGSLARALKELPHPPHVRGITSRRRDLEAALAAGVVDHGIRTDGGGEAEDEVAIPGLDEETFADRDLVVYATPLAATLALLGRHADLIPSGALVTDLASLKAPVLEQVRELGLADRYVGSHPMVGGTGSGFGFSRAELYRGGRVWLVPGSRDQRGPTERLGAFWAALGAVPRETTADDHDRTMVWVSHLPQRTSNALSLALKKAGHPRSHLGSGGRDMTRLGASGAEMWTEILEHAPESLLDGALEGMVTALEDVRVRIREEDWDGLRALMNESRDWVEEGT